MSNYDEYFTNDDKPFAENLNDALLVSNVFDYTVTITVPNMYSNEKWLNNTSSRKAGVSICNLNEELPSGLSLTSNDKAITGTGTLKLRFYPNFNSFGKIKEINPNPAGSISKITIKKLDTTVIYEKTGSTVSVNNVTELSTLQEFIIELTLNNTTMTSVDIVMENKQGTRYGADLKVDNLDGVVTSISGSSTDEQIPTAKTIYDTLMKSTSTTKNGHTHGNLANGGSISTVENTFGSQDMPIIADLSESNKLVKGYVPSPYIKDTNAHTNIGSSAEETLSSIITKIDTVLGNKISKSNTTGFVLNNGTIDTMKYVPQVTSKTDLNEIKEVGMYCLGSGVSNKPNNAITLFSLIVEGQEGDYVKQTVTNLITNSNLSHYKTWRRFYYTDNNAWTSWVDVTLPMRWEEIVLHTSTDNNNNEYTTILSVNKSLKLCQLYFRNYFNSAQAQLYEWTDTLGRIPEDFRPTIANIYGPIWVGSQANVNGGTLRVDVDGYFSAKFSQEISQAVAYATLTWHY